jgi:hypothetical protein
MIGSSVAAAAADYTMRSAAPAADYWGAAKRRRRAAVKTFSGRPPSSFLATRLGFRGFRREEPFSWLASCVPDASQEKPSSRLDGTQRYSFSQER